MLWKKGVVFLSLHISKSISMCGGTFYLDFKLNQSDFVRVKTTVEDAILSSKKFFSSH